MTESPFETSILSKLGFDSNQYIDLTKGDDKMSNTLQTFLATATAKAMEDLIKVHLQLPEDKRDWSPMGKARTSLNMLAECAVMNEVTIAMIKSRAFPADFDMPAYEKAISDLCSDWSKLEATLRKNTESAIAAIHTVPDSDLPLEIPMPWGVYTLAQVLAYPYWNMSYHEGQITYLATMLD